MRDTDPDVREILGHAAARRRRRGRLTAMRVFLAGAMGVIGGPLVPQLLDAGHEVIAMTRSVVRAGQLAAAGAAPVLCDVCDGDPVRAVIADPRPRPSSTS